MRKFHLLKIKNDEGDFLAVPLKITPTSVLGVWLLDCFNVTKGKLWMHYFIVKKHLADFTDAFTQEPVMFSEIKHLISYERNQ